MATGMSVSEAAALLNANKEIMERLGALEARVAKFEDVPQPFVVPINTLAPQPFGLNGPLSVLVEPVLDDSDEACEYVASLVDAGIAATGETVEEAVSLLKGRMVTEYTLLTKLPPERIGKIPRQQLAVLQAVMRRID